MKGHEGRPGLQTAFCENGREAEHRAAFLVVLKAAALLHKLSWGGRLCGKIPTLLKVSFPDGYVFAVGASWQRDVLHESCWEASD